MSGKSCVIGLTKTTLDVVQYSGVLVFGRTISGHTGKSEIEDADKGVNGMESVGPKGRRGTCTVRVRQSTGSENERENRAV